MSHKNKGFLAKVLGGDLSFEHIIFLCGAAAGMFLSAFGAIGNYVMGFHIVSVIIPLFNFIVDIICVVYSIISEKWHGAARVLFFFAAFVLFPFLWFTTGGTMSSSLPLVIGLGVVLSIVFHGKVRVFFLISTLSLYSAFILAELYYPNNFIPYPDRGTWYWDVLFGFVMSFVTSCGLAYITLNRYNVSQRKTEMLIAQLEELSSIDPLTKVFNRRHLIGRLDEEMRKAYDSGADMSLCIIDIDDFKKVNDTHGHLYGDEVLVKVAETISGCLSEREIFGRYGGEEFVVVFVGSNLEKVHPTMDKIYEELRNINWTIDTKVTVSCGVSAYTKGISYSKFLETADANLYKAKDSGRNRVEY